MSMSNVKVSSKHKSTNRDNIVTTQRQLLFHTSLKSHMLGRVKAAFIFIKYECC